MRYANFYFNGSGTSRKSFNDAKKSKLRWVETKTKQKLFFLQDSRQWNWRIHVLECKGFFYYWVLDHSTKVKFCGGILDKIPFEDHVTFKYMLKYLLLTFLCILILVLYCLIRCNICMRRDKEKWIKGYGRDVNPILVGLEGILLYRKAFQTNRVWDGGKIPIRDYR